MNPQQTRLLQELRRLQALAKAHPEAITIVKWDDDPPQRYLIDLHCRGAASYDENSDVITLKDKFRVQIDMGSMYPFAAPKVHVDTPYFNPHVFASGAVCLGNDKSVPEPLDVFVQRLWGLLVWDPSVLDKDSVADPAAMKWYLQNRDKVPFDRIDLTMPTVPTPAPDPPKKPRRGIIWR